MIVECIKKPSKKDFIETSITIGKKYEVISEDAHDVKLIDDNGNERYYQLGYVKKVDE